MIRMTKQLSWTALKLKASALQNRVSRELKTNYRPSENISKDSLKKECYQNIQGTLKTQLGENKCSIKRNKSKTLTDISSRRYAGKQKIYQKIRYNM